MQLITNTTLAQQIIARYTTFLFLAAGGAELTFLVLPTTGQEPTAGVRSRQQELGHLDRCIAQNTLVNVKLNLQFLTRMMAQTARQWDSVAQRTAQRDARPMPWEGRTPTQRMPIDASTPHALLKPLPRQAAQGAPLVGQTQGRILPDPTRTPLGTSAPLHPSKAQPGATLLQTAVAQTLPHSTAWDASVGAQHAGGRPLTPGQSGASPSLMQMALPHATDRRLPGGDALAGAHHEPARSVPSRMPQASQNSAIPSPAALAGATPSPHPGTAQSPHPGAALLTHPATEPFPSATAARAGQPQPLRSVTSRMPQASQSPAVPSPAAMTGATPSPHPGTAQSPHPGAALLTHPATEPFPSATAARAGQPQPLRSVPSRMPQASQSTAIPSPAALAGATPSPHPGTAQSPHPGAALLTHPATAPFLPPGAGSQMRTSLNIPATWRTALSPRPINPAQRTSLKIPINRPPMLPSSLPLSKRAAALAASAKNLPLHHAPTVGSLAPQAAASLAKQPRSLPLRASGLSSRTDPPVSRVLRTAPQQQSRSEAEDDAMEIPTIQVKKSATQEQQQQALPQNVAVNRPQEHPAQALSVAPQEAFSEAELTRMTDKVYRAIESRLRSEKMRRGMW